MAQGRPSCIMLLCSGAWWAWVYAQKFSDHLLDMTLSNTFHWMLSFPPRDPRESHKAQACLVFRKLELAMCHSSSCPVQLCPIEICKDLPTFPCQASDAQFPLKKMKLWYILERVVWNALATNRQRTKLQRRSTAPKQSMGAKPNHISKAPKAETQNLKFLKCYSTKLRGYLVSQIRFWTLPNHLRDVELPHPKRASRTPLGLILRGLLGHNQQMWWWSPRLPQFQMHLSVTPSRSILPPTAAGLSMAPTATPATAGHLTDSSLIIFQLQSKIFWGGNSSNS